MDNFDLKKYLAEGKLFEEDSGEEVKEIFGFGKKKEKQLKPEITKLVDILQDISKLKETFIDKGFYDKKDESSSKNWEVIINKDKAKDLENILKKHENKLSGIKELDDIINISKKSGHYSSAVENFKKYLDDAIKLLSSDDISDPQSNYGNTDGSMARNRLSLVIGAAKKMLEYINAEDKDGKKIETELYLN